MEKLRYWNFLGELFELDDAWVKCLELEAQAARFLARLGKGPRPLALAASRGVRLAFGWGPTQARKAVEVVLRRLIGLMTRTQNKIIIYA